MARLVNFLATDDVPETLFGFPVVTKDYTPKDIAFFKAHPEAGGFYDLEGENDGTGNGPTNGDSKGGNSLGEFADAVSALPAANIDIPAEREKNAARAEQRRAAAALAAKQNRQARIAEMNMLIAQHARENAEWKAAAKQSALDRLAAQRAQQENRAPARTTPARRAPDDYDKVVNSPTGVIIDALGNRMTITPNGLRNATSAELEDARRQNASGEIPKVKYKVIDPFGVTQAAKAGNTRGKYPGAWNNPGNVRPGSVDYAGQTGTVLSKKGSGRFLTFDTPQSGLNSMSNVIGQIVRVKIPDRFAKGELASDKFTTRNLVSVYAPSSENDTAEYVDFVSKRLGVKPDDELSVSDADAMAKLIDAMVRRESGHKHADWFTKDEYRKAAEMMKGAK